MWLPAGDSAATATAAAEAEGGLSLPAASLRRNTDPNAVFVVQGASRGIGLEMARLLLRRTAGTVIATCRSPSSGSAAGLRSLQQEQPPAVGAHGAQGTPRLHIVPLDLEQQDSAQVAAEEIRSLGGARVDALLNVAGMLHEGQQAQARQTQPQLCTTLCFLRLFFLQFCCAGAMKRTGACP
jgi:NAD(P)-dependent dehydrogenase (short-subunit alcohol dehydrogenase family)